MFSIPMNAMHRIVNATSGAGAAARRHHGAQCDEHAQQHRARSSTTPTCSATASTAPTISSRRRTTSSPIRCAGSPCGARTSSPTSINCELPLDNRRSLGYRRVEPFMTNNCFYFWIGQHENGRYSKAHAHTSAAVLICLKGKGYTYTWPERCGEHAVEGRQCRSGPPRRLRAGRHGHGGARRRSLVSPAFQRLEGAIPPDRLVRPAQSRPRSRARPARSTPITPPSTCTEGGTAIPYWMEDPYIRAEYEATLKKNGVTCRMDPKWYEKPADADTKVTVV